jgi:lysophospholipase L1-like esterase
LTDYAKAAQAIAVELNVPFIDLHSISAEHHNRIGVDASMAYNFKEGDKTHFNQKGGEAIAGLILPELIKVAPELKLYLIENRDAAPGR